VTGPRRQSSALATACLIVGLVSLTGLRDAHACFNAYHKRQIVLGSSRGRVVVLDLDLKRVDLGERSTPRWRGPARIGLVGEEGRALRETRKLAAVDVKWDALEKEIGRRIGVALSAARSYPDFQPAGMPRHQPCDFEASCEGVRLRFDRARGPLLSIARGGSTLEVPFVLPDNYGLSDDAFPSDKEPLVSWFHLVSLLSYEIGGREVLVIDVGAGDEERGDDEAAFWPPCGCESVERCPPLAATMHHGSQLEVVVPLAAPPPPIAASPPSSPAATTLRTDQLSRAEQLPKGAPRTDGIYAADPVCRPGRGWSRRFLRFLPSGVVRQVDANTTPRDAFRVSADDAPWVVPAGKYAAVGRRISASIIADEKYEQDSPRWSLDGVLEDDGILRATSASRDTAPAPARFVFTPLK
jgi:hypothetical protein